MKTRIGFTKMVSDNSDKVLRYYSQDETVLIRTAKNGEKVVSTHTDNCNNLYTHEQGKKIGLSFTVINTVKTTHDSKGNKLVAITDKKGKVIGIKGQETYEQGQVYHTDLLRIPFARTFGYDVNKSGHSKKFLRNLGIRSAQGKVIGD